MADNKRYRDLTTEKSAEYTDTTHDDKQVVTKKDPTITTEYKQPWSQNPEMVAMYEQQKKELQDAYHIDPATGDVNRGTLFSAIGVNPELMKRNREEEMERNRMKQKAAALYHSGALISDIISAGAGGNVWKRDKDATAKEAHMQNMALQREQAAEDAANAAIVDKTRDAYYKQMQVLNQNMDKLNSIVRRTEGGGTTSTTTGGDTHTVKRGGDTHQTGYVESLLGRSGSGNGGGGSTKKINIDVNAKGGNTSKKGYDIDPKEYEALTKRLRDHYSNVISQKDEKGKPTEVAKKVRKELETAGVITKDQSGNYKWNDEMILGNGRYFELDDELRTRIEDATGGKIRFTGNKASANEDDGYDPDKSKEQGTPGGL